MTNQTEEWDKCCGRLMSCTFSNEGKGDYYFCQNCGYTKLREKKIDKTKALEELKAMLKSFWKASPQETSIDSEERLGEMIENIVEILDVPS